MSQVFVVGFGKFGQLAIPKIQRRWPKARIWIVDQDPENLTLARDIRAVKVLEDGGDFLWKYRDLLHPRDWIIPAVPFHLAGFWLHRTLAREKKVRKIRPPRRLGTGLPFSLYLKQDLYVSLADFECPENCPSPRGICFRTREKRPHRLGEILSSRPLIAGRLKVLESEQLGPGLGGYTFEALESSLEGIPQGDPPVFLATTCPCHGVITGLNWKK